MALVGTVVFASPGHVFAPITVGPAEVLTQTGGAPDGVDAVTFHFVGSELRAALLALTPHQARRLSGGQPRSNLSGFRDAVADMGAQLTRVSWQEEVTRSVTGVYVITAVQIGPGGPRQQSFDVIVYPCDRLRFYGSSAMQALA